MQQFERKTETAIYLRLSREDGDKPESDSIIGQREFITDFVSRNGGFSIIGEYADDGYSGTNFDRPAFKKMMEDIRRGKVNCIIVKDLSRFGRNYIETGKYLEKLFPFMGVRFISVLDQYDNFGESDDSREILIPFKNLINDAYCRDISTKIRSQLDVKRKNGKFIGSFPSYGYMKDPSDKNHLLIDPVAAETVRLIFKLKLDGQSSMQIAEKLSSLGIPPPAEYKRRHSPSYTCSFSTAEDPKWQVVSVNRILKNEILTGTMVQGLTRKINYKVKLNRPVPRTEWIRVKGTHDPIIDRDTFDRVQDLLSMDTRNPSDGNGVYPLSGFVICADCGQPMVRRTSSRGGKVYAYYHCSTHKSGNGCFSHLVSAEKLEAALLHDIKKKALLLSEAVVNLSQPYNTRIKKECELKLTREMESCDMETDRYEHLRNKVRCDLSEGIITAEEAKVLEGRFTDKITEVSYRKSALTERKDRLCSGNRDHWSWIREFTKHLNTDRLERRDVIELIECIEVGRDGMATVRYRRSWEMDDLFAFLDHCNGTDTAEVAL